MTNNMASSGLWKMLYLLIFILAKDGTIGCVMNDTWCQMVWEKIADAAYEGGQFLHNGYVVAQYHKDHQGGHVCQGQ